MSGDTPAFAQDLSGRRSDDPSLHGLTKREWFAGLAMQGEIAASANNSTQTNTEALAAYSVECADALLAALEKHGGGA